MTIPLLADFLIHPANAQASGTLSGTAAQNGVQITYSISGVLVTNSTQANVDLFQELDLTGTVEPGATITISGSFIQGDNVNAPYTCTPSVSAGGASNGTSYYVYPGYSQSFIASITVPANAQSASVTIQDGAWNGIRVIGSFTVPVKGSPSPIPTATAKPTSTPTLTAEPSVPTPAPTATDNSGAVVILSINREVEFSYSNSPKAFIPAKLDTVLHAGDHVKTSEDSTALIGFGDLSTFLLKPDTEIVITTEPAQDSAIGFVAGQIWINFKGMLRNRSTLDVDTTINTVGVRGTVFVAELNDTVSTIKGIIDDVNVTSKATGESILVGPGQMVTSTSNGLGPMTTFDVTSEEASWNFSQNSIPLPSPSNGPASSDWFSSNMMTITAIGIVVVIIVVVVVLLARRRKPASQTIPSNFPPPPPPQP